MQRTLLSVQNANSIANATRTSDDHIAEPSSRALVLVFDVTGLAGSAPSLQLIVELKDQASGKYVSSGTFTAVTAVGTYTYAIGQGIGAASDGYTATKNLPAPGSYRVRVVGGGTSITDADFTVAAHRL
jgi:hypothetical protein